MTDVTLILEPCLRARSEALGAKLEALGIMLVAAEAKLKAQ